MTRVPFDPSRSLILIKATIYGQGRARTIDLALDVGATTTTIATDIIIRLERCGGGDDTMDVPLSRGREGWGAIITAEVLALIAIDLIRRIPYFGMPFPAYLLQGLRVCLDDDFTAGDVRIESGGVLSFAWLPPHLMQPW